MKKVLSYLKPFWKEFVLAVFFIMIDVAAEILQPTLMVKIVGTGVENQDLPYILKVGGMMVLCSLISIAAGVGNSVFSSRVGNGFAANLRDGIFRKIQTFSFKNIDKFSTAALCTRITTDVQAVQMGVTMSMRIVLRAPLMLIFSLIMALRLSGSLSVIFAGALPVLVVGLGFISIKLMPMFNALHESIDDINKGVQENITNIRVVKSFVSEEKEKGKFHDANDRLTDRAMKAMAISALNGPFMNLVMNTCMCLIIWFGGNQIIGGRFDVANLTAFINYLSMALMSLMMISMVFVMVSRAIASYKRVKEIFDTEPEIKDDGTLSGEGIRGRIEFKNVCFKYSDDAAEPILKNISFKAEAGETLAIIGGTGSGKSSLVQLIPRLYEAYEGEVLIDDHPVSEYRLFDLREKCAMILQVNTLFSGTIKDNLRWGNENATDDEIIKAAQAAQANEFIESFPEGYDHWIEQGGVNVSGGQKQRLCIARALVKNPPILILDDSTSAVDTATERKIRKVFAEELADTTVLIIAQRISSVMGADKIIVLDNGAVVGQGTHEELMQNCEEYRQIYYSQVDKAVNE